MAIVELHDLTNKDSRRLCSVGGGRVRLIANPKRPSRKCAEVQAVEFGQFEEDDRVGLLDQATLDLGQVRVRSTDAPFDLAERQLVMDAGVSQGFADLRAILAGVKIGLDRRSGGG